MEEIFSGYYRKTLKDFELEVRVITGRKLEKCREKSLELFRMPLPSLPCADLGTSSKRGQRRQRRRQEKYFFVILVFY